MLRDTVEERLNTTGEQEVLVQLVRCPIGWYTIDELEGTET